MTAFTQPITTQLLAKSDMEGPIEGQTCVEVDDFESCYLKAANAAETNGDDEQALVYRAIAAICTFDFRPTDKAEPFSNRIGFADGSRSLIGSDFSEEEIAAFASSIDRLENVALRTRLADLVWSRDKACADIGRLHGVKNVRELRQQFHDKLKDAQLHLFDDFQQVEHSTDLSVEIDRIIAQYEGLDLLECLKNLAITELPRDPDKLIASAKSEAQRFPLQALFPRSIVDTQGRTIARTGGGFENEDALRYKVIQNESIRIGIGVAGAIMPVLQLITERFVVSEDLLYRICLISPFTPPGSEHTFARGIRAFIYGDFVVATATLVPLLEAGLRSMVGGAGRSDTKISAEGIEQTIGLGPMLAEHREALEAVFGKAIIFSIENLFVHELGPKIRHYYCHGLSRDGSFYSDDYIYGCKLIFSLVLLPLVGSEWDRIKTHLLTAR